jgi:hypothetical protein
VNDNMEAYSTAYIMKKCLEEWGMFYDINIIISIDTCDIHNIPTQHKNSKGTYTSKLYFSISKTKKYGMKTNGNTILHIRGKKCIAW